MKSAFVDHATGQVSSTKIWYHIGCAVCTWIVINKTGAGTLSDAMFEIYLWGVAGAAVLSKGASVMSRKKTEAGNGNSEKLD